jgi:Peptidase family M48.
MNYLKEQNRILNEQYYGKNAITLKIEQEFALMKQSESDTRKTVSTMGNVEAMNKHARVIEGYLKDLFNFKTVSVTIADIGTINAYTYSVSIEDIVNKPLTNKTKNTKYGGIMYTDEANRALKVVLSNEIICKPEMTPAVLTAVLLHEIGHNFYIEDTISFTVSQSIMLIVSLLAPNLLFMTSNFFKGIHNNLTQGFKDTTLANVLSTINNNVARLGGLAISILTLYIPFTNLNNPFLNYIKNAFSALSNPLILFQNQNTYNNELFADNFATSYGYGPEIIEMSRIFNDEYGTEMLDKWAAQNKWVKAYIDYATNFSSMFSTYDFFRSRAGDATRSLDQISFLKANLKNIDNSDQRAAIKKDLDNAKKNLEVFKKEVEACKEYSDIRAKTSFDRGGEVAYTIRDRHYNDKGNWKNMV